MKKFLSSLFKTFSIVFSILFGVLICNVKANCNNEEHRIPIAMATDGNYVYTTVVAMTSMLENKNDDTYLDFYVMISGEVSKDDRNRMKLLENLYQNCSVKLIDMKNKFQEIRMTDRITVPTYYRLALPSIMAEYDKILYLDGDIIVRKDLWDMYSADIKDNYIAGVKDFGIVNSGESYAKRMGIKDLNKYVNAGILVMNINQMRKDNIEEKFNNFLPELKHRRLFNNDQDVINAICYDKIKFLSPEYNAMQHFCFDYKNIPHLVDCYDMQEYKKSCIDPAIVHYTYVYKPWKGYKRRFYNEWDKYRNIAEQKLYDSPVIKNGIYSILSSLNDKKSLDIVNASKNSGANLQLWDSNFTDAQKFQVTYAGEGCYEIKVICSGKYLDVEGAKKESGANVWQYDRNNTYAQRWIIKSDGNGYYYLSSKCNGLYLDVRGSKTQNGTNIHMWNFNGSKAQKFKIVKVN